MKKSLILLLLLISILSGCSSNTKKSSDLKKTTTTTSSSIFEKKSQKEIDDDTVNKYENMDYDSYDTNIPLDSFERTPEEHKGDKRYFEARIFQVVNNEDDRENNHYLATINVSKNETKTILLFISQNDLYDKILKNDEIKAFVHFVNLFDYETVEGTRNEIPAFYLDAYSIIKD